MYVRKLVNLFGKAAYGIDGIFRRQKYDLQVHHFVVDSIPLSYGKIFLFLKQSS